MFYSAKSHKIFLHKPRFHWIHNLYVLLYALIMLGTCAEKNQINKNEIEFGRERYGQVELKLSDFYWMPVFLLNPCNFIEARYFYWILVFYFFVSFVVLLYIWLPFALASCVFMPFSPLLVWMKPICIILVKTRNKKPKKTGMPWWSYISHLNTFKAYRNVGKCNK